MSFLSYKFFVLVLTSFYIYWNIPDKYKRYLLIVSSSIFYMLFSIPFYFHLCLVILINFYLNKLILQNEKNLKYSILFNVFNLIFFKYFYFVLETFGLIFQIPFLQEKVSLNSFISSTLGLMNFEVVLPATISYYTFQFISLSVDISKKKNTELNFFNITSYILFFPIMIAGPITRLLEFKENFKAPEITKEKFYVGIWLILMGYFKKLALSDSLMSIIVPVFSEPESYSGVSLLLNSYFFAMNLYLDFSGLTDIARGFGILFGYDLPVNFKAPFFMDGFSDFWRRWHLSFSFWIRDYIYIPLGGSRVSEFRNYINLIITFTIGGLWHGSSFNYLLWGVITGVFISIERFFEIRNIQIFKNKYSKILKYIFVLHLYIIPWNLFFTSNLKQGFVVISKILTFSKGLSMNYIETGFYVLIFGIIFHLSEEFPAFFKRFDKYKKFIIPVLSFILVLILLNSNNKDFFYEKY